MNYVIDCDSLIYPTEVNVAIVFLSPGLIYYGIKVLSTDLVNAVVLLVNDVVLW